MQLRLRPPLRHRRASPSPPITAPLLLSLLQPHPHNRTHRVRKSDPEPPRHHGRKPLPLGPNLRRRGLRPRPLADTHPRPNRVPVRALRRRYSRARRKSAQHHRSRLHGVRGRAGPEGAGGGVREREGAGVQWQAGHPPVAGRGVSAGVFAGRAGGRVGGKGRGCG